jgi:hypothetical protein
MKLYIGLSLAEDRKTWIYEAIDRDRYRMAIHLYALELDGHQTKLMEYDTDTNMCRWDYWNQDSAFFMRVREGLRPTQGPLRPEDV